MRPQRVFFHNLSIGDKFVRDLNKDLIITYRKETKSSGKGIKQSGYRNQRAVGGMYCFASFETVFRLA